MGSHTHNVLAWPSSVLHSSVLLATPATPPHSTHSNKDTAGSTAQCLTWHSLPRTSPLPQSPLLPTPTPRTPFPSTHTTLLDPNLTGY